MRPFTDYGDCDSAGKHAPCRSVLGQVIGPLSAVELIVKTEFRCGDPKGISLVLFQLCETLANLNEAA